MGSGVTEAIADVFPTQFLILNEFFVLFFFAIKIEKF